MLARISHINPLIVVVNNIQFIKPSSLFFTKFIIKKALEGKILFIFTLNRNFNYLSE